MSTWRALPRRRRVALVLMTLCLLAVGAQMYALGDRAADPSPTTGIDAELVDDAATPANDFIPTDRDISECISAIPKPGCGSEARGGWHQTIVLLAILAGLALITWRIVVGARKAKAAQDRRVAAGQ